MRELPLLYIQFQVLFHIFRKITFHFSLTVLVFYRFLMDIQPQKIVISWFILQYKAILLIEVRIKTYNYKEIRLLLSEDNASKNEFLSKTFNKNQYNYKKLTLKSNVTMTLVFNAGLFTFGSPLLSESFLVSFPPFINMLKLDGWVHKIEIKYSRTFKSHLAMIGLW